MGTNQHTPEEQADQKRNRNGKQIHLKTNGNKNTTYQKPMGWHKSGSEKEVNSGKMYILGN